MGVENCSDAGGGQNAETGGDGHNAWATYSNVYIDGATGVDLRYAGIGCSGTVEFRLNSSTGTLLGSVAVSSTGAWQSWTTGSGSISGASGTQTVCLKQTADNLNMNWFTFTGSPASASVATSGTQQFTASGKDQFGRAMTATYSWTVSGGGTINTTGLFTAGTTAGGPYTVTATSGSKSGTASVTVTSTSAAPTVATAAAASPSTVTGTTSALSVLGADDGGEANLTYTWAATTQPSGASVTFSANGTNAAKASTATFNRAGSYTLQCTIKDAGNLTVTSSVNVTVSQTLTTVTVSPASGVSDCRVSLYAYCGASAPVPTPVPPKPKK